MKRAFWFFLFALFLLPLAFASSVNVNIKSVVSSEVKETHNTASGLLSSEPELYNSGSIPYSARLRMAVYNGSEEIFSGWSKKENIMPGERKNFMVHAYVNASGTFLAKITGHYANDAFGLMDYNYTVESHTAPSRRITLSNPRVYGDRITLSVMPEEDETGIILLPTGYPKTWIFEEKEIPRISAGKPVRVSIPYDADIFLEKPASMIALSKDGRAFGEIDFVMKREEGISKYVSLLRDWLSGAE